MLKHITKLYLTWLLLSLITMVAAMFTASSISKPGCQHQCGNLTVPYPFGIENRCYHDSQYRIICNTSYHPPKAFLNTGEFEILDITPTQMRIRNKVVYSCGKNSKLFNSSINLGNLPCTFSDTSNKFTVVGCYGMAVLWGRIGVNFTSGCGTMCSAPEEVVAGSCSGIGCCETAIPKGLKTFNVSIVNFKGQDSKSSFDPCSFAFLAEADQFAFEGSADLIHPKKFLNTTMDSVPVVLEWYMGNDTCSEAQRNMTSYACQQNTICTDFDYGSGIGYRCICLPGYEGNPYLSPGCTDIDECADPQNPCSVACINIPGSFKCTCPKGYYGDGMKNGTGCAANKSQLQTKLLLGMGFGFLFLLLTVCWGGKATRKRRLEEQKEKFFQRNGGLLLKQKLYSSKHGIESTRIFTAEELKAATDNYSEDRILGKGGYGTVYKGILPSGLMAAIKKSKVADESQVEQFINEVIILTQINHRNVVKLLGCCLETEVPLLVYEFISNGSLSDHIHCHTGISWLSWSHSLRIAAEAANALAYLHSAASIPIIHRDVKSANILIDESYTAKISDFGASRLVPMHQTQVTTLVQGTLGYLDPEYLHTSQLTEKSDVYSFGVVLAELLTKQKPLSLTRKTEERNLANYFIESMKEDRLFQILHPQLVKEATRTKLVAMTSLVKACLSVKREDRPTMKEVAIKLEGLRKQIGHPRTEGGLQNAETESLTTQEKDPGRLPSLALTTNESYYMKYSLQIDMMAEMSIPR
ncbi:Wall-associated receptor kinase 5-like protein [Drosera capensis]